MILTRIWSRITCHWHFEWLSTAAWSAMAHAPVGVGILTCVGGGWLVYHELPPRPVEYQRPASAIGNAPGQHVPEPWSAALLGVGVAGLVVIGRRR